MICYSVQSNGQYVVLNMVSHRARLGDSPIDMLLRLSDRAHHLHHVLHGNHPHRVVGESGEPVIEECAPAQLSVHHQ